MVSAKRLARYIIFAIKERMTDISPEEFDITPLKLQKLLYYCQGYSLALTGKPAFPDPIEAWQYGPVVDSVYQDYKQYSGGIIPYGSISREDLSDEPLEEVVKLVIYDKVRYSGETLARATHQESPWRETFAGPYTNIQISNTKMRKYFSNKFSKREEEDGDTDEAWDSLGETVSVSELEAALEEI